MTTGRFTVFRQQASQLLLTSALATVAIMLAGRLFNVAAVQGASNVVVAFGLTLAALAGARAFRAGAQYSTNWTRTADAAVLAIIAAIILRQLWNHSLLARGVLIALELGILGLLALPELRSANQRRKKRRFAKQQAKRRPRGR